jgi:hypothetical protein
MNALPPNAPLPVRPPPDGPDAELAPLLAEPLARAWSVPPASPGALDGVRHRLAERLTRQRAELAPMVSVRRRRVARNPIADGVTLQTLYRAPSDRPLRPGEPRRATLVELAPGARWDGRVDGADPLADPALQREWLVLQGPVQADGVTLGLRDYHVVPAGHAGPAWSTETGALLFVREAPIPARDDDRPHTVFDAEAGWPDFVPGIQRRVLWQRDGQAALLYFAQPGMSVPLHTHGHDEECLMVQGDLFLDDLLLQAGDYQVAPAGTGHRMTETDTGGVIYAHGDLDLQFVG